MDGNSERYVFMGMTHIAKINNDDSREYYGTNHLGSTTLSTDEDGIEILNKETNPFGDQVEKGMFFTGKQWDEDAQLYYFNARWYDPETGGFITEDPVKDSLLWYAYVSNNPLKFVDPTGLYINPLHYYGQQNVGSNESASLGLRSSNGLNTY